jgi:hypothetical protein
MADKEPLDPNLEAQVRQEVEQGGELLKDAVEPVLKDGMSPELAKAIVDSGKVEEEEPPTDTSGTTPSGS